MFPEKWTGKGETITWPPRSPDRTPLDYYLVPSTNIPTPKIGALKWVPKYQVAIFSKRILNKFQQFVETSSLSENYISAICRKITVPAVGDKREILSLSKSVLLIRWISFFFRYSTTNVVYPAAHDFVFMIIG